MMIYDTLSSKAAMDATVRPHVSTPASPVPSPPPALRLVAVSRWFAGLRAVAPLTLTLEPGAVCTVEGPNGSGKTTLLRLAAGLLEPSSGQRSAVAPALYLRAGDGARGAQTVRQAIAFAAGLGTGDPAGALHIADLDALADVRVELLSSGQRARVTLGVALAARPALVCLDEPTAHLDHAGAVCASRVIERLAGGGTAVMAATHDAHALAGVTRARLRLHDGRLEQRS